MVYVPTPPIILSTHLSLFIAFDAIEVCVVISVIHQAIPHDASVRVTKTNLGSKYVKNGQEILFLPTRLN